MIASKIMEKLMKKLKRTVRPIRLDTKTWRYVEPILRASQAAQSETGRFKYYGYLVIVFRTYIRWKHLGISKRMARQVARCFEMPRRKGTSPVRTLIDATFPTLDRKQKSRWTRALELAAVAKTPPGELVMLFKNYSGIAGCARLAADQKPKKNTYRDDWAPDPTRHEVSKNCDFNGFGNDA
jgi:hypothetical protein